MLLGQKVGGLLVTLQTTEAERETSPWGKKTIQNIYTKCAIFSLSAGGGLSPPSILEHPASLVVVREEPATLRCEAAGDPEPEIIWMRTVPISGGGSSAAGANAGSSAAGGGQVMEEEEEVVETAPTYPDSHRHRRRITTWGTEFIQFLAALYIFPQDDSKERMNRTTATWQNGCFEKMDDHPVHIHTTFNYTSPNQHRRPLSYLLYLSFF